MGIQAKNIKEEVWRIFACNFVEVHFTRLKLVNNDSPLAVSKIKQVVSAYGGHKASRIDGFTFQLAKEIRKSLNLDHNNK